MPPPPYLNSFNVVRFIAAVCIVLGHFFQRTFIAHEWPGWLTVMISSAGSYYASLFFIISGFVLAYARQRRASQGKASENPLVLFARHLKRAAPYMVAGSSLMAVMRVAQHVNPLRVVLEFLYSNSLIPPFLLTIPSLNRPAWAMSVFALGYLINAFCGDWLGARSTKQGVFLTLLLAGMMYSLVFLYGVLIPDSPAYPPRTYSAMHKAIHIFPLSRVFEVILGMLLGSLVHRKFFQIKGVMGSLPMMSDKLMAILIVVFNLVCLALISTVSGKLAFLLTHGLLLIPSCMMLVALAVSDDWVSKLGLVRIFTFLGNLSIPLYLLHWPSHVIYARFVRRSGLDLDNRSWMYMLLYFSLLFILSVVLMGLLRIARASFARFGRA